MNLCRMLRSCAALILALLILSCGATTAFASDQVDLDRTGSLTVAFRVDETGCADVTFDVYRVAEVSEALQFTLTGDFAGYPVEVNGLDSSGWRALAQTLSGYVARDGLNPLQTDSTGADGQVAFASLPVGLYLVVGDQCQTGSHIYTPEPLLVCLPGTNDAAGAWVYDVEASCKYDSNVHQPEGSTVSRKVLKVWEDDGGSSCRPDAITVQLLQDGEVCDTVTLNSENSWRYSWDGLDSASNWQVVERETPEGYTVSVRQEGITFVMTNTLTKDVPPSADEVPGEPELPQTGMLWWPVPVLFCGGLLLFLLGSRAKRHATR